MKSLYWIVAIFAVIVAVLVLTRGSSAKITPPLQLGAVNSNDHVKGSASSTVVVIEYADFQCPACRAYYPIMREVEQQFGDKIAFIYRYFPLPMHVNAEVAAFAAEAAGRQGKFWEMHDLLYEKQDEWATSGDYEPLFENYAKIIGVSVDQFKTDFESKEVRDMVRGYESYGNSIDINATPTFYINGKKIDNPQSAEAFKLLINQALNQK